VKTKYPLQKEESLKQTTHLILRDCAQPNIFIISEKQKHRFFSLITRHFIEVRTR